MRNTLMMALLVHLAGVPLEALRSEEKAKPLTEAEIRRTVAEIRDAWQDRVKKNKSLSASYTRYRTTVGPTAEKIVEEKTTFWCKSRGDEYVVVVIPNVPEGHMHTGQKAARAMYQVRGRNNRYYFHLEADSVQGPFRLVKLLPIERDKPKPKVQAELDLLAALAKEFHYRGLLVDNVPILGLLEEDRFRDVTIVSAQLLEQDGREKIRIVFRYNRNDSPCFVYGPYFNARFTTLVDAAKGQYAPIELIVDKSNGYRIERVQGVGNVVADTVQRRFAPVTYRVQHTWGTAKEQLSSSGAWQYSNGAEVVETYISEQFETTARTRFVEWSEQPPDRSEFYLTAFGLPEPIEFQAKRGGSLWWWLAVFGFTCIVVGFGLWRWYEKRQEKNLNKQSA